MIQAKIDSKNHALSKAVIIDIPSDDEDKEVRRAKKVKRNRSSDYLKLFKSIEPSDEEDKEDRRAKKVKKTDPLTTLSFLRASHHLMMLLESNQIGRAHV